MESRLAKIKASFVRISTEEGTPVGAGFLVSEEHVMTCAHVVAAALRMSEDMGEKPKGAVHLDFPFVDAAARAARVEHWLPPSGPSTNPTGDIAILRLASAPPDGARLARLTVTQDLFGHTFRAHGYPQGYDAGVWAYGELRDRLGNGWLQVEDTKGTGSRIEPGFSGGPVEDRQTGRIVGMVVASTRDKVEKVGFVIPTEVLARAWPRIGIDKLTDRIQGRLPETATIMPSTVYRVLQLHTWEASRRGSINSLAFSPDGRLLASSGSIDKMVRLWQVEEGELVYALVVPTQVTSVAFSPDGRLLASGGLDGTVRLWGIR